MLKIIHNAGFFSCCSVKICIIIQYFTTNKKLPNEIDSSGLFDMYKVDIKKDITYDFFEMYSNKNIKILYEKYIPIDIMNFQFDNYKNVDYMYIIPFVEKYFSPSQKIIDIRNYLLLKYNIDTENCLGLYYRGTDKYTETQLDSFDSYYNKLIKIIDMQLDKNIQIIIQTDTSQFLEYINEKFNNENNTYRKNIIIIEENSTSYTQSGIHNEKSRDENYIDIQYLYATFLIISKCKYIICSSGNCSIWMMYNRGCAKNVYQNLNKEWL